MQFVGTDTMESVEKDRLCFLGAAPFRTPTAKEKACAGRSVEVHLGGRAARARVKRVFVSDDEGPAHDETLCGLIDDAEPSRERTVRAAELLRAVRTATHVKWADASVEEAPSLKRSLSDEAGISPERKRHAPSWMGFDKEYEIPKASQVLLCTKDVQYQEFRKHVRNPKTQAEFIALPLNQRRAVAANMRSGTQASMLEKDEFIMDVEQSTVERVMQEHDVKRLIHGHTHRPANHTFEVLGQTHERITRTSKRMEK